MTAQRLALVGALFSDPTRAGILIALMDGRAHTGGELARHVDVAASTASEHLSKLVAHGMVTVTAQGRHRYFQLADPETAHQLEALVAGPLAPPDPPRAPADLTFVRTCYDHPAGTIAVAIYEHLRAQGHMVADDDRLVITDSGFELFTSIGVDIHAIAASPRPQARSCLDWTERRHHLAGSAGKGLLDAFLSQRWFVPGRRPRSIRITDVGYTALRRTFALPADLR